jgi:alcohol dehydrogenase class IV
MPDTLLQAGASASLAARIGVLGRQRAFVVTDRGVVGAGFIEPILAALAEAGIEHRLFAESTPTRPTATSTPAWSPCASSARR